eukprot:365303-Chlamydomonas_euryale.AAC.34
MTCTRGGPGDPLGAKDRRDMVDGVEMFKRFYEQENKHRRLAWFFSLGMCHLKANFDTRAMELILGTQQATCLLLFNDADELTFSDIVQRLNLAEDDTGRVLHSLACAKHKILLKEPANKTIGKTDKFMFNNKFTNVSKRLKIPLPPVDEKKKVIEDVDKDRRYAIDAAIVRTMKSRKSVAPRMRHLGIYPSLGSVILFPRGHAFCSAPEAPT